VDNEGASAIAGSFYGLPERASLMAGGERLVISYLGGTGNDVVLGSPVPAVIDIKLGSDPNCFNIDGHGVIPAAINGSAQLDVADIDVSTLILAGLEVRLRGQDVPQCSMEDWNADGYLDLVCQFEDNPDNWEPGSGVATLTGFTYDGTLVEGTGEICVVP
jgi:hypothetical protein